MGESAAVVVHTSTKTQGTGRERQHRRRSNSRQTTALFFFILLEALLSPASAQIGVELCACFPSVYTFILNFDQACNETSIPGAGIDRTDCFVSASTPPGSGGDPTDEVPVAVSNVDILELGQNLRVIASTRVTGDFRSGDDFSYASVLSTPEGVAMAEEQGIFPGGLQLNIQGRNALDEFITNVWVIVFSNDCGLFPVIEEGDQIGWTTFVSVVAVVAAFDPSDT